jgi:hypothetical protein
MIDLWWVLMWGALGVVAVSATVLAVAVWIDLPGVVPPLGDLTWDGCREADACDCAACGAPTELPDALVVERFLETTKEARP